METIEEMLIRHEGIKLKLYRCPAGKLTIGVGRNLDDVGISRSEAVLLLKNDIKKHWEELLCFDWFHRLNQVRANAFMDMHFNLGHARFLKFEKMLAALSLNDYDLAASEMLNSKWARQTGERAKELAYMVRLGTPIYL